MEEKASDAKVKFLGGHVEALVKETISCGVSRGEVIELFLTYWEKEQKKILESEEQLKKKEERNEKILSYPMEEFIKNAIRQNVCKSSAKNCISKLVIPKIKISNKIPIIFLIILLSFKFINPFIRLFHQDIEIHIQSLVFLFLNFL